MKSGKRVIAFLLVFSLVLGDAGRVCGHAQQDCKVFQGDGYQITVTSPARWADGYLGEVVITNTGTKAIQNWKLISSKDMGVLENVWNVNLLEKEDSYIFECQGQNRRIATGASVSFGYQASGKTIAALGSMELKTSKKEPKNKGYEVTYQVQNSWDNHAVIEAVIYNTSDEVIKDWELQLDWDADITNIWNADMKSRREGGYVIEHAGYNQDIPVASCVTFGFQAAYPAGEVTCPAKTVLLCEAALWKQEAETTQQPENSTKAPDVTTENGDEEEEELLEEIEVDTDWNRSMIHADSGEAEAVRNSNPKTIKVCILDSGIDYIPGLNVVERKDFLDDYEEDIMYNDVNGHGTAIAGILAANPKEITAFEQEEEDKGEEEQSYIEEIEEDYDEGQFQDTDEVEIAPQADANLKEIMKQDGAVEAEEEILDEEEEDDFSDLNEPDKIEEWLEEGEQHMVGVNPNVAIYSGRILDEENETTVGRAVRGIEWAIENKVHILSISWGMDTPSKELYRAIQKANKAGILIIAAAGNEGSIPYPACYKEVMAVGSVNSEAKVQGGLKEGVEVVAPGEDICSYSAFGMLDVFSGSSFAVPQVVGLAALILQKDDKKSPEFVRQLIDITANPVDGSGAYGYGIIDCEQALKQYDEFSKVYQEKSSPTQNVDALLDAGIIEENNADIKTIEESVIKGLWSGKLHVQLTKGGKKYLKIGAKISDSNKVFKGMKQNPGFHGYYGEGGSRTNYIKAYLYLTEQAVSYLDTGKYTKEYQNKGKGIDEMHQTFISEIDAALAKTYSFGKEKNIKIKTKKQKFYFVYGMALHTLADIFAHSAYAYSSYEIVKNKDNEQRYDFKNTIAWTRISHGFNLKNEGFAYNRADNRWVYKARYLCAYRISKKVVKRVKDDKGDSKKYLGSVSDFNAVSKQNVKRLKKLADKSKKSTVHDGDELYKLCKSVFLLKGFYANIHSLTKGNKKKYKALRTKARYMDLNYVKKNYLSNKRIVHIVLKDSNHITFKKKNQAQITVHYKKDGKKGKVKLKKGCFSFVLDDKGKDKKKVKYWVTIKLLVGVIKPGTGLSRTSLRRVMPQEEKECEITKQLTFTDTMEEALESENWAVSSIGADWTITGEDVEEREPEKGSITGLVTKDNAPLALGSKESELMAEPLSRVNVSLRRIDGTVIDSAITDDRGGYQFLKIPAGEYVLHYEAREYLPVDYYITVDSKAPSITPRVVAMIQDVSCDKAWYGGAASSQKEVAQHQDVAGLTVEAREGINNKSGRVVETVKTKQDGLYELSSLSMGYYTLHIFREGASRYPIYEEYFVIAVNKERVGYMESELGYVQSLLKDQRLRVKLDWASLKEKYQSCLVYQDSENRQHQVSYANRKDNQDVQLSYDIYSERWGYLPPETLDIYDAGSYGYDYYVYSEDITSDQLQKANISVRLYEPGKDTVSFAFTPPVGSGKYWKVFHYDGATGEITPINRMVDKIQ